MQNHTWAKTLLSSYRFLDRIAGAIDKIIDKKALASSSMLGRDILTGNTLSLTDKIIELSERKVKLINIKVLTEKALEAVGGSEAKILIGKYVEKKPVDTSLQELSLCRRTYFRKMSEAEAAFEASCARMGYSSEKLDNYLKDEAWIMEVKDSFEKGEIHNLSVRII